MSHEQKVKVIGSRASTTWLLIIIAVALVTVLGVGGLIVYPQLQAQQEAAARAAEMEARAVEVEQHYQAGIAFQNVEDWTAAESEFKQVIMLDADYKDAQARLAEVKSKLAETEATTTAVAIAIATQAQADAQATAGQAQVDTQATATQAQADAQATAAIAQATAEAAPVATAEALEERYQRALGLINLEQWVEAQTELQAIFDIDPNYKDVQTLLATVNAEITKSAPTATLLPQIPSTRTSIPTPAVLFSDDFSTDPNGSGLWQIYRHSGDISSEAAWDSNLKLLYLTRPSEYRAVAMFASYELTVTRWEALFRYKVVEGRNGADGFVFMFYKDKSAFGKPGCGGFLGFQGGGRSDDECTRGRVSVGYGIEFDSHQWQEGNSIIEPSPNHIALIQDSPDNHLVYVDDVRTEDNAWHEAQVRFDKGQITVLIDGQIVLTYLIPNPDYTYSGMGFSAATGYYANQHVIDDFVLRAWEP